MLPFLKNKEKAMQTGVIVKTRAPDDMGENDAAEDKDDPSAAMEAAAHDLISAIHSRDASKVAEVIKDIFELVDALPHVEGPHLNESEE